MRGSPRGAKRSVDRGMCRPGIERRKPSSGCRCSPDQQKATWHRSHSRDVCQPSVVEDPGMHTRLLHGAMTMGDRPVRGRSRRLLHHCYRLTESLGVEAFGGRLAVPRCFSVATCHPSKRRWCVAFMVSYAAATSLEAMSRL